MYSVSQAFLTAAKQPIQTHRVVGTIGNVSFDDSNIVQGTFNITNQCSDTSDVTLGSVYTGTLTATFHGVNINRYAWINKEITPYFGMQLANLTWEEIPLGVFTVKEARHTAEGVEITAYDNMIKLDKKFKKSKFKDTGKMFEHISTICTACGIYLANTEAEIQAMPNGNTECGIVGTKSNSSLKKRSNDIETYRDLVYWIAQTMACFATMDRAGMLKFVRYQDENATVDTITEAHQLAGASFNDYVTRYTGIYVTNSVDDEELYYGYDLAALNAELTTATNTLSTITSDLADLEEEYEQGQITEEEYLAQKKTLNKQKRNVEKRITWLNKAIANVEDGEEDGAYLELGCNPILQPDGVGATYTTMRTNVLNALDVISYTPFTCDTVCGVHYDLGDVLQFTGGHAGSGECCCLMCYDWTLHGAYSMQGFGQDPALQAVKSKTAKSANQASKNATTALNENDLVFDVDTDNNNAVVATNKKAYTQTLTTRVIYIWAYNVAWPPAAAIYKVTVTSDSGNFAIVDFEATSGPNPCNVNGIIRYNNPAWLVWELPEGSPEPNITVSSERVWDNGYHPEYTLGDWWANGYNRCVYTESGVSWYANSGFQGSIQHGIAYEYREMPDKTYESEAAMRSAVLSGKVHPAGVSPYDQSVLAKESTAMQTAANAEYFAEKLAGNNPTRKSETYSGSVNVMSENTMQRLSDAFYQMGEAADNIGAVSDVKVDGTSVVTDKIANINTMTGATAQADGTKGLVPAPASGDEEKYLRGDGTWGAVSGSERPLYIDSSGYIAIDYDLVRTES